MTTIKCNFLMAQPSVTIWWPPRPPRYFIE
jgi:hypothetical protein